ncbi:cysteine--tRNA ligase [Pontiella sp.]|uniref:cysteine--tRNA ligase n=1 Tax=Pontiella sp. TaxID=2837462 RepID=UPI003562CFE8
MAFKIYNTMSRTKEELVPVDGKHVRMYTCGPTVYNYAHIGNFRAYMFEDLLRRYIKFCGFEVTQVQNLTDVDDKTIRSSIEQGLPLKEYTKTYIDAFFEDLARLNIEPAEHYPAATDYIPEMISIIEKLFEKGYAYQSDDGSVYYSIDKFESYGKLAHLDREGMQAGARVAQDEYDKDNAADFALWKAYVPEDGDVVWDSPWGKGRPGWHIECSAMSMKLLGESFDIHTGGVDNIFPHHEDEIAQSEAATGKTYSKYWMHCGYLVVDGRKMSKSLGNFYTLREILDMGYTGREVRYELLSSHYRQSLNFAFKSLDANRAALKRLDEFYANIKEAVGSETQAGELPDWAARTRADFAAAMDDDMNISGAMAAVFDAVHAGNKAMSEAPLSGAEALAVSNLWKELDSVLGLLIPQEEAIPAEVEELLEARTKARAEKDWAESDRIRDRLAELGWTVKDTPEGPKLRKL